MAALQLWLAKSKLGHRQWIALEAKLDRTKREWTIIGVMEFGGPEKALELDWKAVVSYDPATQTYGGVDSEYFGVNGETIANWTDVSRVPVSLRPVATKAGKDDRR
jgi:hypothetical protein